MRIARLARALLSYVFALGLCIGLVSESYGQDTTPPTVVSTYPANGATEVNGGLRTVSITFSEPMRSNVNFNSN